MTEGGERSVLERGRSNRDNSKGTRKTPFHFTNYSNLLTDLCKFICSVCKLEIMGRSSEFPSLLCEQICTLVLINIFWNSNAGTISLIPETLETCGIFLQDSQPSSCNQRDVLHEIIEHLQLKQKRPQSLIIQNGLSQEEIQPDIFRSMKYDWLSPCPC